MVYITAVHMEGGTYHEHIASVQWRNPQSDETGESTRAAMVDWIKNENGDARVRDDAGHDVRVGVVDASPPYIRTYADRVWTDNLLALPRY
jgi:catechol-2,3-dioxygenase